MNWHRRVPREPLANLEFRRKLCRACAGDKGLRRDVIEACRHDILFYFNAFAFTYDPRSAHKLRPFATYPFQDDAILQLQEAVRDGMRPVPRQKTTAIFKPRDMGVSWFCLGTFDHFWRFVPDSSFLLISRVEELVDGKANPKSLFWKLDFLQAHLPPWFPPQNRDRTKLHHLNLDNGSVIDGEATTGAGSVGDRRTGILIDEYSRIPLATQRELLDGTRDTSNCVIFNYTPFGTAGPQYELTKAKHVRKIKLHWSQHPKKAAGLYQWDKETEELKLLDPTYKYPFDYPFIKDGKLRSPWYDQEERERSPQAMAMMVDVDFEGSSFQFFNPDLIDDLVEEMALPAFAQGEVDYLPDTHEFKVWVRTPGGTVRLWLNLDGNGRPPCDRTYVFGADVAAGSGASNSCLSGFDCKTGEKILELASAHLMPQDFAYRTLAILNWFTPPGGNGPKLIWEMEGPGTVFGQAITQAGYRNVYLRRNELSFSRKQTDTPGWVPTDTNKLSLLSSYQDALATQKIVNRSEEALEECKAFVVVPPGKIEHSATIDTPDPTGARKNHGDRVIADALAVKLYLEKADTPKQQEVDVILPNSLAGRRARAEERRRQEFDEEVW